MQQPQAQMTAGGKPSRRSGRGSKRFTIVRNGQKIEGLNESQLRGLIDWEHCDGEHKGEKVASLFIGQAGDDQIAIAQGDDKRGITLYKPAEVLVAMSRLDALCHKVFDKQRAAGKI